MKEMGWTLEEYRRTPVPVIEQVWAFINTDIKIQEGLQEQK